MIGSKSTAKYFFFVRNGILSDVVSMLKGGCRCKQRAQTSLFISYSHSSNLLGVEHSLKPDHVYYLEQLTSSQLKSSQMHRNYWFIAQISIEKKAVCISHFDLMTFK